MQNSFYNLPRPCFIYLLLLDVDDSDPYYFIGKSFASCISKVYSRHLHAGFVTTKDIFSVGDQPKLYILEDRPLTGDDAYRYIISYTKYFSENELGESLNYDGTQWQSKHLKPETEKIYQEIAKEPLSDLLRRTYVPRAVDADRKREESMATQEKKRTVQLNIAVAEEDKILFDAYSKKIGASRREAFGVLLEAATTKTTEQYERLIIKKEQKIEEHIQEIKKLEHKLALASGAALPKKELWASMMYPFMIEGIKRYISLLFPEKEAAVHPIQSRPYKGFAKQLLPDKEYIYPPQNGFYLIHLQAILWGKHKSCFYMGVDVNGNHYRMRYYAKEWFLGIPPRGSGYEEQNSLWLCGLRKSTDGAMDLVAALPLPHVKMGVSIQNGNERRLSEQQQKTSLADRIADIERL